MSVQATPAELGEIEVDLGDGSGGGGEPAKPRKSMTIGAVCKALSQEFPDISISKIRFLEDQKLLSPRRTPGGYRLYTQGDVARLRTILRMQRDNFLPLRVIRQELATGAAAEDAPPAPSGSARPSRAALSVHDAGAVFTLEDVLEDTRADASLVKELEDFGVIKGASRGGVKLYDATELARYGVAGRNLRVFRTSADREGALLQQILAPALGSRNAQRRKEAVEA